jgi:hypothetical protein
VNIKVGQAALSKATTDVLQAKISTTEPQLMLSPAPCVCRVLADSSQLHKQ